MGVTPTHRAKVTDKAALRQATINLIIAWCSLEFMMSAP